MRDDVRSGWRPSYLWLVLLALSVRAAALFELRGAPVLEALVGDGAAYDAWARQITGGDWIGHGVFYQSPLYPYVMGVIYRLAGPDPMAVRAFQVLTGAAACALLARAAERLLESRVAGWAAGVMLALCPMAVFFDLVLQKSALDGFLVCLLLWLVSRMGTPPVRGALAFWLGVAGGFFALNRENALLSVAALLAWLAWMESTDRRRAAQTVGLAVLGAALVLSPVLLRNGIVGGDWQLTTSQLGPNFFIGNRAGASGTYEPLRPGRGDARFERQDATELAEAAAGRTLSPAEVSAYWRDRAVLDIRGAPGAWLRLMGKKTLLTVNATEIGDTEDLYTWSDYSRLLRSLASGFHMGWLVPLAAGGAAATWRRRGALAPVYLLLLCYASSVVLFYVFARYRYPLVPPLIVLAAGLLTAPWRTWFRAGGRRQVIAVLASAAVGAVLANLFVYPERAIRASSSVSLGTYFAERGRFDRAIPHLARAVELDPASPDAAFNLGLALYQAGLLAEADHVLSQALSVVPDHGPIRRLRDEVRERRATPRAGRAGS